MSNEICRSLQRIALVLAASFGGLSGLAVAEDSVSPTGSVGGFEAKFIEVNGVRTRYYDVGDGEPLVLVHGSSFRGTANANTWTRNMAGLSEHYRVIAPDAVGAGMTDNPHDDDDYNMQGMVQHLLQFVETMGLTEFHLMGQSTGGAVVFFAAVERPDLLKTLIIVNSQPAAPRVGPTGRDDALRKCRQIDDWIPQWKCVHRALSYDASHLSEEFLAASTYMEAQPKVQETYAKRRSGAGEPHFFTPEGTKWLESVHARVKEQGILDMPVLLYWSRNDPNSVIGETPVTEVTALFDVIGATNPNVRLLLVNKAGHFHYRERPEEFNYNVISFIEYWK
jgi:2-hydroxy-6-oxo-6-(2'-carboxyphenyl)-hexa-2,4-dienoate hydrolase